MRSRVVGPFVIAGVLALSGCTGLDGEGAAAVAERFVAEASQDPAAACTLLAPATLEELEQNTEKACPQALADLGLDAADGFARIKAYGTDAQVALPNQTVFLSRFDDGWKVVAAGCTSGGSQDDVPYTCPLKGR